MTARTSHGFSDALDSHAQSAFRAQVLGSADAERLKNRLARQPELGATTVDGRIPGATSQPSSATRPSVIPMSDDPVTAE